MALTKRQIQSFRKSSSSGGTGEKMQEFLSKYQKMEEQAKEREKEKAADKAEREAYVNELTRQVEEQKKEEQAEKVTKSLERETVPFNSYADTATQSQKITTPSERVVEQQKAAIGSYNNRMMNPQSQVAKRDALSATLSTTPVNIKAKESPVESIEETGEVIAQDLKNRNAVDQFNKTGTLPDGLTETEIPETHVTTYRENTVLPGVTRKYTEEEQLQVDIDKLNEKKKDVLFRKSQAKGTAHQELANEANEIQDEIDSLQAELDKLTSKDSGVANNTSNLPGWVKGLNTAAYTAGRFGLGAQDTVENWASAIQNTVGDLATYGGYSNEQNKLYSYLSEHPEMRREMYVSGAGQQYARQKVADAAGVSLDAVNNYARTSRAEDLREGLEDIEGVSDTWKNYAGNWAESIGQQVPGMMLGAGGAAEGASDAAKKIAENATLGSIGTSVYGQTLEQLSRERGFDINNYINATLQGAIEVGTEKMGFTDLESLTNPATASGNTAKSVGRAIVSYLANGAEEGIEEVINAPMSEIADRLTGVSENKNLVGDGGIFDIAEMAEGGLSGFAVGMIMGGVGSIAGIVNTVKESKDIKQAVEELAILQSKYPPAYRAEIPTDFNSITSETLDSILAEQTRLWKQLEIDAINGNVKYGATPESEQIVTNKANAEQEQQARQTAETETVDNTAENNTTVETDNTVDNTNNTFDATDNTISDTNNTTNNTENIDTETVEDTVVDEDSDYDYSDEMSYDADSDSAIAEALRTVNVNPVSARRTLLDAYDGNAKAAVDALYAEGNRITKEGGEFVTERLAQVEKLRDSVLANSERLSEEGTQRLTKAFQQYGIKNAVVDSSLVTDVGDTSTNAMYDPATKTIHVSPLLGTDAAIAAYATHELTHHAITADSTLVSDILAAKESLVKAGLMDADTFNLDRYVAAYADVIQNYGQSAEGKAALQKYIDSGMDAESAKYRVVEDYLNEEIAADFMAELANNPDIAKKLTSDNRNFIQKIYDAIVDFINKLRGKEDVRKYQRLADTLRSILSDATGETVAKKKVTAPENKAKSDVETKVKSETKTETESDGGVQKKFSLSKPVEETENLVAVHNSSEENIVKSVRMGGFAGVSAAIVNADEGHNRFGDFSVVFYRGSIDPKLNEDNHIYSADAWTPTYPRLEYKFSQKFTSGLKDLYNNIEKPSTMLRELVLNPNDVFWENMQGDDEAIANYLKSASMMEQDYETTLADDFLKYIGKTSPERSTDYETRKAINQLAIDNGYLEWVDKLVEGGISTAAIRNNEPIVKNGNIQDFDALHYEYTLENVVKAMKEQGVKGATADLGNIFPVSTKEYSSIDEVKKDAKDRLRHVERSEYAEARKSFTNRLDKIREKMDAPYATINTLVAAAASSHTEEGIDSYLREHLSPIVLENYTSDIAKSLSDLVKDIQKMPTEYFEAKLMRVTPNSEVAGFIVPDNAKQSTMELLESTGRPVLKYAHGDIQTRVDALNSLEGVRFSKQLPPLSEAQEKYFADSKIRVDENGRYDEDGELMPVYHATDTEFTVFDRSELGKFTDGNATDISYAATAHLGFWFNTQDLKRSESNPITPYTRSEQVYLNIENPKELYSVDMLAEYLDDYYGDTPQEVADAYREDLEDDGYDGIVIMHDGEFGGMSFVAFNPNQIKRVDNANPTANEDKRFSRDVLTQEEKDNIRLREQKEYYKQQLATKGIAGDATVVSPSAKHKVASGIASKLPGVSTDQVSDVLSNVYAVLDKPKKKGETFNDRVNEALSVAMDGAKDLVEDAVGRYANPLYESMIEVKRNLRETRLYNSISEEEFGGAEDFKAWKKSVRNNLKLTDDKRALHIDMFYMELCETNPELFPPDITNPAEQLKQIGEVAQNLKGLSRMETGNPFEGFENQVATELANDIVMGYFTNAKKTVSAERANKAEASKQSAVEKVSDTKNAEIKRLKEENKQLHKTAERALETAFERKQAARNEKILERLTGELYKRVDKLNAEVDKITQKAVKKDSRLALATEQKKFEVTIKKLNEDLTRPTRKSSVPETLRSAVAEMLMNFEGAETKGKNPLNATTLAKIMNSVDDNRIEIEEKGKKNGETETETIQDNFRAAMQDNVTVLESAWELVEQKQAEIDRKTVHLENAPTTKAEFESQSSEGYVTPLSKTEINSDISTLKTELSQLKTDYYHAANNLLSMVKHYINQQNKIFIDGKWQDVDMYADNVIGDLTGKRRYRDSIDDNSGDTRTRTELRNKIRGFARGLEYESLNASLFLHAIGDTGDSFERRLRSAGTKSQNLKLAFEERMFEVTGGTYDTTKASGVGNRRVTLNIGDSTVDASKAQCMTLYLLWQREDAKRHLQSQGACFLDKNGEEFTERTFAIDEDVMSEVKSKLSAKDIEVADAIGQFLSNECSKAGNDATLEMYGFAAFLEDHYFPMDVATRAKLKDAPVWGIQNVSSTLEDVGFMKHVNPRSTCALRIGNVFDVAEAHVAKMAAFSGYAPVLNDMQKVFRRTDVREAMVRGMGKEGVKYMNDFLKRANQNELKKGGKTDTYALFEYLGNMAKRNAVMFNMSTTVKQFTSIFRAGTEIEWEYLNKASTLPFRRQDANTEYSRTFHRMVENSGIARMKIEGNSETGFGKEMRQGWDKKYVKDGGIRNVVVSNDVTRGVLRAYDKFTDLGMWSAGKADETTLVRIWKASELKVNDLYPDLTAEQKLQKTTEIFETVIGRTQVVDSLLDSAPFKDKLGGVGTAFGVFMNEPVKTFGNLCVAVEQFRDGKPGSGKHLANVLGSILVSNVIVEPLISAMFSGWRDEEDDSEQAFRKLLKNYIGIDLTDGSEGTEPIDILSSNVVQGVAGIIPAFGEVYEIFTNAMQGYSSNSDMGVELAEDMVEKTAALLNPQLDAKTKLKKISDFVSVSAQLCGIPYQRFAKGTGSAIRNVMNATGNHLARWEFNKLWYRIESPTARSSKYFYDIMADAYKDGDTEAYRIMREELNDVVSDKGTVGVSAKTITNAIEQRGGKIEVGSDLWYIDLQAGFDLESFNPSMKVEKMITSVYKATNDDSILPSSISNSFTVNKKTVKIESPIEYQKFAQEAGDFAYMILANMDSDSDYKELDDKQKAYAIQQAYNYARKRSRKNYNSDYDFNNKDYTELYESNATASEVAKEIIWKAEDKDYSEDEDEDE